MSDNLRPRHSMCHECPFQDGGPGRELRDKFQESWLSCQKMATDSEVQACHLVLSMQCYGADMARLGRGR